MLKIKDIPGFEGLYKATYEGKIISYQRKNPLELKGVVDKDGYFHITLYKDGKGYQGYVHKWVSLTFLPNPNNLPVINHKDENKQNNCVSNLERCTNQYNIEYSKSKEYEFISPDNKIIKIFNLSKFCKEQKIHKGCMSLVAQGKRPHHRGWRAISC